MSAPSPRFTVEAEPIVPYVPEDRMPERLTGIIGPYRQRMGFLPNALRLYAHRPEIAELLFALNNAVMRDPSSTLEPFLKRRLAAVASRINGCTYCTAHHCGILKRPAASGAEGWGLDDGEVRALLTGDLESASELERACFEYVRTASESPSAVGVDLLERLKAHLSPPQIVELACVVGFWKLYNTIHESLHVPLEAHLLGESGYVDVR